MQSNSNECLRCVNLVNFRSKIGSGQLSFLLYLATFIQPYCKRFRHVIASAFYPERKQQRIVFLHGEILRRRKALKASLPRLIPGRLNENKKISETFNDGNKKTNKTHNVTEPVRFLTAPLRLMWLSRDAGRALERHQKNRAPATAM